MSLRSVRLRNPLDSTSKLGTLRLCNSCRAACMDVVWEEPGSMIDLA